MMEKGEWSCGTRPHKRQNLSEAKGIVARNRIVLRLMRKRVAVGSRFFNLSATRGMNTTHLPTPPIIAGYEAV